MAQGAGEGVAALLGLHEDQHPTGVVVFLFWFVFARSGGGTKGSIKNLVRTSERSIRSCKNKYVPSYTPHPCRPFRAVRCMAGPERDSHRGLWARPSSCTSSPPPKRVRYSSRSRSRLRAPHNVKTLSYSSTYTNVVAPQPRSTDRKLQYSRILRLSAKLNARLVELW